MYTNNANNNNNMWLKQWHTKKLYIHINANIHIQANYKTSIYTYIYMPTYTYKPTIHVHPYIHEHPYIQIINKNFELAYIWLQLCHDHHIHAKRTHNKSIQMYTTIFGDKNTTISQKTTNQPYKVCIITS